MSVVGISSALSALYQLSQNNSSGNIQTEFQQLGQDLLSGNLSQAQTDYSNLAQAFSTTQPSSTVSAAQSFTQLGQDLQSGNLSAAQQDYTQVQQDLQQGSALHGHHHHHHGGGSSQTPATDSSQQTNDAASVFAELGQSLQSGNLSTAQQAYSTLQQDFLQYSLNASNNLATQPGTSALNFTV